MYLLSLQRPVFFLISPVFYRKTPVFSSKTGGMKLIAKLKGTKAISLFQNVKIGHHHTPQVMLNVDNTVLQYSTRYIFCLKDPLVENSL
jgi:hypothetical protein